MVSVDSHNTGLHASLARFLIAAMVMAFCLAGCGSESLTSPGNLVSQSGPASSATPATEAASSPSTPSSTSPTTLTQTFRMSGTVRNNLGLPLGGVPVTIFPGTPNNHLGTRTDASGRYDIEITLSSVAGRTPGANIEVTPDGTSHDWFRRSVLFSSPQLVEDFTLQPRQFLEAGGTTSLAISSDISGGCYQLFGGACARVTIRIPADGNLTVEAISPNDSSAQFEMIALPQEIWAAAVPLTLNVNRGNEIWVEIAAYAAGGPVQTVQLRTSLQPK